MLREAMTETLIPEGRAKAEAMRTYLARGGGLSRARGVYHSGPMRGKTQAQAEMMFEDHWQRVGSGVKEKYAKRANNVLAPSERLIAGLNPVGSQTEITPVSVQKRQTQLGDKDGNGIPDMIQRIPGVNPSTGTASPAIRPQFSGRSTTGASPSAMPVSPTPAPIMPTNSAHNAGGVRADLSPLAQREMQKRKSAVDSAPTGRPVMSDADAAAASTATGGRVSVLTGLPMGFAPGDALPVGASPEMVKRRRVG